MTRFFALNSLAGAFRTTTAIQEITTAGKFDSAYVANGINVPSLTDYFKVIQPFLDGSTSLTGAFYLRFDIYPVNASSVALLTILNAGANGYRILLVSGNTFQVQYWNSGSSAWVNWGGTFTLTGSVLNTCMLKLQPNVGYTFYSAGTSLANSAVVPTNGATAVDEFQFGSTSTNGVVWSQIMCADSDIRDAHLMPAAFTGNSVSNTGGTGSYTDVNETILDEGTAEIIAAAGKMGQTHAAITVPSGLGIGMAIINARGRVSGGTVTDGKLGFRVASTNYSSGAKSFNGGYEPRSHGVALNPNTSTAWTQTTFNAAETFLEAV